MSYNECDSREFHQTPPPTRLISCKSAPEHFSDSIPSTLICSQSLPTNLEDWSQQSKSATLRKPDNDEIRDESIPAPYRAEIAQPTQQRYLNQPRHDNWKGPFRLPPRPPVLLVVDDQPAVINKKTFGVKVDCSKMESNALETENNPCITDPAIDTPTSSHPILDFSTNIALEHIIQVFPNVDLETTKKLLQDSSLETVMNKLAEESHGAWGEVDSICGLRDRRRSCSSDDDSVGEYLLTQLDQIAEIFPDVDTGRSEHLLRRNSLSTVLMILASEASLE